MPIEANYKTYYGIHLDHYSTTWGGVSYNKLLVTDFPDANLESTDTTASTNATFLYPRLITNMAYLDGVAEGHITLYNNGSSTTYTVSNYTVTIKTTEDVADAETTIGTTTQTISSKNTVAPSGYLTLPVYISISKKTLGENEKLLLYISFTSDDTSDEMCISHANDSDDIDIQIKLPYAPQG